MYKKDCDSVISVEVSDALNSDHKCVIAKLRVTIPPPPPPAYRRTRNIRAIDRPALRADFVNKLSPTSLPHPTADQVDDCLRSVLDVHAPATRRRVASRTTTGWYATIAEELQAAKRERRRFERKKDSTGLTIDLQIYKAAKDYVTNLVIRAKTAFYNAKISAATTCRELYTITNRILGRNKSTPLPTLYPTSKLPALFAEFFVSKVKTIRDKLDSSEAVSDFTSGETSFTGQHMSNFNPISDEELKKIILSCKPTTCELDPMPTSLLIECIDEVLPAISFVINNSLSSGVVPSIFKQAVVKPLLKKPSLNQNELKNYRPVSNLPFLSI